MEIGEHCSFAQCNRLDFLPFTCDYCQQIFCKNHRVPSSHDCRQQDPVSLGQETQQELFLFQCSLTGCKKRDVTEITCVHCENTFCIQHRHQQDHNCPVLRAQEEKRQSDLSQRRRERNKGGKEDGAAGRTVASKAGSRGQRSSSGTRAKVAMMSLKLKAVGLDSIPQSERVYYEVKLPKRCSLPNTPMFFSMEWSVGRVVDYIAQKFKLKNENHKAQTEKLLLLKSGGEVLSMSASLHSLLETEIPTGASVTLEYEGAL